jgi:polyisoprenyl-teichoic acid--peptidoglycan teichoic acid transferase
LGMGKVNAAYRVGGPQLAVKTLNQNFALNIENFVSVDFNGLAHVIDALDGLTLDVKKEELRWVNSYLDENNKDSRVKPPYLSRPGMQTLNGPQAVAYTRVRQVGTDSERTQRQRTVLSLILKKLKSAGASEFPNIVSKVLPYVDTSIPSFQLLTLGATVFTNNMRTVEERRFPLHTESKGQMIDGSWYLVADLKATSKSIFDFMFEGSN